MFIELYILQDGHHRHTSNIIRMAVYSITGMRVEFRNKGEEYNTGRDLA